MSISKRENMLMVYRHEKPEFLPLSSDLQMIATVEPGYKSVVYEHKKAGTERETDWFGQDWIFEPKIGAFNPDSSKYIITDAGEWESLVTFPDFDEIDWRRIFSEFAYVKDENKVQVVKDGVGLWERAFDLFPMDELLCGLLIEPEAMSDFFKKVADHKIRLHNLYIEQYHPDVLRMHDDYGYGGNLFMSPETWRELIKPQLQRVIDNVTSQGVLYEHHCCGYMASIAEEIADMGAVSWNNVHVSNNPAECKKKFGKKMAFICGICDGQFMDSDDTTEEQIKAHIRKVCEDILPGEGSVINAVLKAHPERTAVYMNELIKCGEDFYGCRRPQ